VIYFQHLIYPRYEHEDLQSATPTGILDHCSVTSGLKQSSTSCLTNNKLTRDLRIHLQLRSHGIEPSQDLAVITASPRQINLQPQWRYRSLLILRLHQHYPKARGRELEGH
jgi:hypothetical protein